MKICFSKHSVFPRQFYFTFFIPPCFLFRFYCYLRLYFHFIFIYSIVLLYLFPLQPDHLAQHAVRHGAERLVHQLVRGASVAPLPLRRVRLYLPPNVLSEIEGSSGVPTIREPTPRRAAAVLITHSAAAQSPPQPRHHAGRRRCRAR